ncbi:MAG: nucleotide exchange factor GrpE [Bdellovibrionaceae bacterium]|nr:nucleotide exchange factor GrpE [Pseudobdellovibrionaceae bacterium]
MKDRKNLRRAQPRKLNKKQTPLSTPPEEQSTSTDSLSSEELTQDLVNPLKKEPELIPEEQKRKEEYEALNTKYHFLMAEYANYKKNNTKKLESIRKYEGQHIIHRILTSVMDDFDRAIEQELTEQNITEFKEGIRMIYNKLKLLLKEVGVKEIDCTGAFFDPTIHCAVDAVVSKEVPPEHIIHVIKKAYFFHDKLIRPAEVIVSRKSTINHKEQNKNVSG